MRTKTSSKHLQRLHDKQRTVARKRARREKRGWCEAPRRGAVISAALVALALVPSALAASPTERLSVAASAMVTRPVVVECVTDDAVWVELVGAAYGDPALALQVGGYALIPEGVAYLSPLACRPLVRMMRGKLNLGDLAGGLHIYAHEVTHLAGFYDEATTEACGLRLLPHLTRALFRNLKPKLVRDIVNIARQSSALWPDEYQGGTC